VFPQFLRTRTYSRNGCVGAFDRVSSDAKFDFEAEIAGGVILASGCSCHLNPQVLQHSISSPASATLVGGEATNRRPHRASCERCAMSKWSLLSARYTSKAFFSGYRNVSAAHYQLIALRIRYPRVLD
jgi:hypothetical protein